MTPDETTSLHELLAECDRHIKLAEIYTCWENFGKNSYMAQRFDFTPLAARTIKLTVEALLRDVKYSTDPITCDGAKTALRETLKLWKESKR